MGTKATVSFYSFEKVGGEVIRTEVDLVEVEDLITVLKRAASVRFEGNDFEYVDYYVDIDDGKVVVQVNID